MRLPPLAALLVLTLVLAACGGDDPAPAPAAGPMSDAAAPLASAAPPAGETDTADAGTASLGDLAAMPGGDALAGDPGATGAEAVDAQSAPDPADTAKANMAEMMAAMADMTAAGNDEAKRKAAMARLEAAQLAIRDAQLKTRSDQRNAELEAKLPEEWREQNSVVKDGPEADLVVRVGDIDNMGFGWPEGFDPFRGKSTPRHDFPYLPEDDDPQATDRIMVVTGHVYGGAGRRDGYTETTSRPANLPQPLVLEYALDGIEVKTVALQLFVDDFQSRSMGSRFRVWLDDREATDLPVVLNALDQTGPIGKLLTLQLLPEYLDLVRDGRLEIRVDDPDNTAGDGFAFDFARLLINPKGYRYTGTVRGIAVDTEAGRPLAGVLVSAANVRQALTDDKGGFVLEQVPAGLVVTTGSKPDYSSDSEAADLEDGQVVDVVLELAPIRKDSDSLAQQLEREGKVDLYGIYFDTAKASLKPESEATLQQVLGVLTEDAALKLVIAGHTDSEGGDAYNQSLSEQRAASVVAWLTGKGIDAQRLRAEGLGEARPVADNATEAGRALNRRVELRVAD
ncbi:OmpA family protein [Arenimonas sp. MALMAid1274]|uniref:OmpA family protein n=1 Tax=Arenimonas sp. MALMAid1274 TaxID=3411630 RepID=UPI003BA1CE47